MPKEVLVTKGQKRVSGRSSNTKGNDNIISNGSGIAVADGQCIIIVEQSNIVEVCAEPGEFTYDTSTEPSIFSGSLGDSIKQTFKTIGKRFTYGGDTGKDKRVYYFNTKDVKILDKSLNNDVKRFCQSKTREAMDILNPRKIIFLCTQGSELSSVGVTNIHGIGNFMKAGIWKEKEVIALPNPGYYAAYSYSNGFEMGKKLEDYLLK